MKTQGSFEQWQRRFLRFKKANCTVREWCEGEGIPAHQFYYWRRRLQENPNTTPVSWCALELTPESGPATTNDSGLSIHIGSAIIKVQPGFHAGTLREVVAVLEEAC